MNSLTECTEELEKEFPMYDFHFYVLDKEDAGVIIWHNRSLSKKTTLSICWGSVDKVCSVLERAKNDTLRKLPFVRPVARADTLSQTMSYIKGFLGIVRKVSDEGVGREKIH